MKKFLAAFLVLTVLFSLFTAGCSSTGTTNNTTGTTSTATSASSTVNTSGTQPSEAFPVVKDKITLKFITLGFTDVRPPANELWMWKEYEKMTNIHIEWEEIASASAAERKSIILASNELPDCFYRLPFTPDEISKYGNDGTFIALENLIQENAPNLNAHLETNKATKQAVTMPDGHIYSLPYIQPELAMNSVVFYVNQKWLDALGLKVPQTLDEYTNILREFKKYKNVAPLEMITAHIWAVFEKCLYGSFGLANRGGQAATYYIDADPNGKVRFFVQDPRFKEVWQYLKLLWDEELLHKETFTGIDLTRWTADASNDLLGAFNWVSPAFAGANVANNYTGIAVLKGPHGDQQISWIEPNVRGIYGLLVTNKNKYPKETLKWVDYFYSEEGSLFGTYGKEGVTYTVDANGNFQYIDEIKNYKSGAQLGAFQYVDNVYGGFYPYIEPPADKLFISRGTTFEETVRCPRADYEKYAPKEMWPTFNSTPEESAELTPIFTDLVTIMNEARAKFVMGELDFDKDWDKFMADLDKAGAKRYVEIKQKQLDRLMK